MAETRDPSLPSSSKFPKSADTIPWHLSGNPLPVQVAAHLKARGSSDPNNYGFFMEMGLGKSALELNEWLDTVEQMAVVCPNNNKVDVWLDQIRIWCPHVLKHTTVWPERPTGKTACFIMNFEATITLSGKATMQAFLERAPTYFVASESQNIKNHNSARTKAMLALRTFASIRRLETGTPWSENVTNLWPQLRFIDRLRGTNPYSFKNRYAKLGGWMGKKIIGVNEDRKPELERMLDQCSFLALKKDWTNIPEKRYIKKGFEMTPRQVKLYREMKADFVATLSASKEVSAQMVITQMMKLQQISRGFIIDEMQHITPLIPWDKNPSLLALGEVFEETPKKVIIFCHFRYSCTLVHEYLTSLGLQPMLVMGEKLKSSSESGAMNATRQFNDDSTCRALVCQSSMATGYTWLGQPGRDRCSVTVFYEDTYSVTKRLQAEDRNHRNGQDEDVTVIDLMGSKQDRDIWDARTNKQDIAAAIVNSVRSTPV